MKADVTRVDFTKKIVEKEFLVISHLSWTVWKFQIFSVILIQILREINFGEYRNSKTTVFAIFRGVNFDNLLNFSLAKVQNFKIQSL